jgi:hypothetical protein
MVVDPQIWGFVSVEPAALARNPILIGVKNFNALSVRLHLKSGPADLCAEVQRVDAGLEAAIQRRSQARAVSRSA